MNVAPPLLAEYWTFEAARMRLEAGGGAATHGDIEDMNELASAGSTRIRLWAQAYLKADLEQALLAAITEDEHEAPSETGRLP